MFVKNTQELGARRNRSPPTDDAVAEPELARGEVHPVQAQLEREGELLQLLRRQVQAHGALRLLDRRGAREAHRAAVRPLAPQVGSPHVTTEPSTWCICN